MQMCGVVLKRQINKMYPENIAQILVDCEILLESLDDPNLTEFPPFPETLPTNVLLSLKPEDRRTYCKAQRAVFLIMEQQGG